MIDDPGRAGVCAVSEFDVVSADVITQVLMLLTTIVLGWAALYSRRAA